ncbi:hypothetical protein HS125_11530 [bacterium]|nr:hypothetical protein [bacterium]
MAFGCLPGAAYIGTSLIDGHGFASIGHDSRDGADISTNRQIDGHKTDDDWKNQLAARE